MTHTRASSLYLGLVLCCFAAAIWLAGAFDKRVFTGRDLLARAQGDLSSDGWIGARAEFSFPGYAGIGNSVFLNFSNVRPGAAENAKIAVSVCNRSEQVIELGADGPLMFPVPTGCSPVAIVVRALNFFSPPLEKNPRLLGVQLRSLEIRSIVGVPLLSVDRLAPGLLFTVAMLCLVTWIAQRERFSITVAVLAAFGIVGGFLALVDVEPWKLEPLGIAIVGILLGVAVSGRDGQEPQSSRFSSALLWVALIIGASLRLYGIRFGLPSNFHPDEVPKVNAIMRMVGQQSLDPHYFLHPSLLLYCTYGVNTLLHIIGIEGTFRETAFFAGRLVSATAGIVSIVLTYCIGRRLFSRDVGALAACLLAVFPLHVTCSRYLKEDALLTVIVLACTLTTIIAVQSQRRWLLLIAGLLAGCTAGAKYSGILMVIVPGAAPWIASRSWKPDLRWLPWSIAACVVAPLGFLVTTPYAILNSAKFTKDFLSESRHMQTGHTVAITAWSQLWMYHFWRSIWPGVSGVAAVGACVALGSLLRRRRLEGLFIVALIMLFYMPAEYVKAKPAPQPERYILPCLPFLAIAAAELIRHLRSQGSTMRFGATVCAFLFIAAPFSRSVTLARDVTNDTRDLMAQWMKDNIPHGSKVLMDWKPYCPNFHGQFFQVEHIARAEILSSLGVDDLRNSGADYLILSSLFYARYFNQPETKAAQRQMFREVFNRVPIIKQIQAPSGPYGFHNPVVTLFSLKAEDFARLDAELAQRTEGGSTASSDQMRARLRW